MEISNYDAIRRMSVEELAHFLDNVYLTGLNNGMYAERLQSEEEKLDVLDEFPYDENWLTAPAEPATMQPFGETGDDDELTEAFVKSVTRGLDIEDDENESD